MNKKYLTMVALVIGVLVLTGAGCGKGADTGEEKNESAKKTEETKSEKNTTSKNAQQTVDELREALMQVFGETKLTANQPNLLGNKGWTGLSYSVTKNPTEADTSAINAAMKKIGYDLFKGETNDSDLGRNTIITYFSSQHFATLAFYANKKDIEITLMPADEARKLINEEEQKSSQ